MVAHRMPPQLADGLQGRTVMRPSKNALRGCGAFMIVTVITDQALATMPLLTEMPKHRSPAACLKWAEQQKGDTFEMWGIQETGKSSCEIALSRLVRFCMDEDLPEILGFGSSVGVDEAYCENYPGAKICEGPPRPFQYEPCRARSPTSR
jgi:hypothetical protein